MVKEKKEKIPSTPSPYGTTVILLCADPDMDFATLKKALVKKGIDTKAGESGIRTGFGVVRKIVGLLKQNGLMN